MSASVILKQFRQFEIRWAEPIGLPECPYVTRWVFTAFDYSLRVHRWSGSDDLRAYHDHAWDYWSYIVSGYYWEYTPDSPPRYRGPWKLRFYKGEQKHKVKIDKGVVCWSIVFSKPNRRKFGFYVPGREKMLRPLRYFSRYKHHPCE